MVVIGTEGFWVKVSTTSTLKVDAVGNRKGTSV